MLIALDACVLSRDDGTVLSAALHDVLASNALATAIANTNGRADLLRWLAARTESCPPTQRAADGKELVLPLMNALLDRSKEARDAAEATLRVLVITGAASRTTMTRAVRDFAPAVQRSLEEPIARVERAATAAATASIDMDQTAGAVDRPSTAKVAAATAADVPPPPPPSSVPSVRGGGGAASGAAHQNQNPASTGGGGSKVPPTTKAAPSRRAGTPAEESVREKETSAVQCSTGPGGALAGAAVDSEAMEGSGIEGGEHVEHGPLALSTNAKVVQARTLRESSFARLGWPTPPEEPRAADNDALREAWAPFLSAEATVALFPPVIGSMECGDVGVALLREALVTQPHSVLTQLDLVLRWITIRLCEKRKPLSFTRLLDLLLAVLDVVLSERSSASSGGSAARARGGVGTGAGLADIEVRPVRS